MSASDFAQYTIPAPAMQQSSSSMQIPIYRGGEEICVNLRKSVKSVVKTKIHLTQNRFYYIIIVEHNEIIDSIVTSGGLNHHCPKPPKIPTLPPAFFSRCTSKLPLYAFYTSRMRSTTVERTLQIAPFCAKQTQSKEAQNQRNPLCRKELWKKTTLARPEKTNPIKPNLTKIRDSQYAIRDTKNPKPSNPAAASSSPSEYSWQ